ncbi:alginate lyase [Vallitalea longa]|uniref:Alginate lyase n=1 Tax=Vallitalea longa TaxID=2936439 RepID=A0A9W6DGB9_9FIRM|nr:alginate lyase family protein [Vallitalea longa]GKX31470.1 alginate lyase [Vallitalea longa]
MNRANNDLHIFVDQMRFDTIGALNNPIIKMPVALTNSSIKLIYYNEDNLLKSKGEISKGNNYFIDAYNKLISKANKELDKKADPVTNKTIMPQSGDIHDYLSIAPYFWPDPSKKDGIPWIPKDGQVNPKTRGPHTDQVRLSKMFDSLEILSMAYYFSGDKKYADKAKEIIKIWFIDEETKVNPSVKYGQGVPGGTPGRQLGIIEWTSISNLIIAVQLLDRDKFLSESDSLKIKTWLTDYLTWLRTSNFGKKEDDMEQNHGTNYDTQVVGIMIYLDKKDDAEKKLEEAKIKRIASQILSNGSQPLELRRTKSVNYSTMNLWTMSRIADIGRRFTRVDLWQYESSDGRSMRKAFEFLKQYIFKQKQWEWKQITGGGAESQLQNMTKPMLNRAGTLFNETLIPSNINAYSEYSYMDILQYPPKEKLEN